jgi:hypothetical protein
VGIGLARPGSTSAALGNAVVLRMNNMGFLPAETDDFIICIDAGHGSPVVPGGRT